MGRLGVNVGWRVVDFLGILCVILLCCKVFLNSLSRKPKDSGINLRLRRVSCDDF